MKRIIAVIRQEKYEDVKRALLAIGCEGMNVSEVKGRGHQLGIKESYRGSNYCIDLIPKTRIELIVNDEELPEKSETARYLYPTFSKLSESEPASAVTRQFRIYKILEAIFH